MSAPDRLCSTLAAVAFALTMLVLGLMNPHAAPGRTACGLSCDAPVSATPFGGLQGR